MIIRLNAGNDRNGNPRRVFVRFVETDPSGQIYGIPRPCARIAQVWDEGYEGVDAIPEEYGNEWSHIELATTPAEYRRLLKTHGQGGTRS